LLTYPIVIREGAPPRPPTGSTAVYGGHLRGWKCGQSYCGSSERARWDRGPEDDLLL